MTLFSIGAMVNTGKVEPFSLTTAWQLAQSMPDGILVADKDGTILFVNDRLVEMTGYQEEELKGSSVDMLVPDYYRSRHPQRRQEFMATPSVRPMGSGLEIKCRRADGSELDVDIALSLIPGANGNWVVAAVRDATERKTAERARREAEERFRLLLDSVRDYAIFVLDIDGNVVTWNTGAERLKEYTAEEIIGKNFSLFYTSEDIAENKPARLLVEAIESDHATDTGVRVRKDGSKFQALVTITQLKDDYGTLRGFAKVTRDITEQLRTRDDLERLRMLEQREGFGRDLHDGVIQSIFAVGMSLQSMMGLTTDPLISNRVSQAVEELDTVIRDLRAYIFHLGQDRSTQTLHEELQSLAASHHAHSGIMVSVAIDETALAALQPYANELLLVIKESLSNVAKHSGAETCRLEVRREKDEIVVEIDDDGHGFDTSQPASGLGLASTRTRAQTVGARHEIASSSDGTTVRLRWPA